MDRKTGKSLEKSVELLSQGFLKQFDGLLALDRDVNQLLVNQDEFTGKFLQDLDTCDHEMVQEFSALMKKMDLYRMKVRNVKSDMIHIASRVKYLKDRSIKIQEHQIKIASEKVNVRHYEESLIPRNNLGAKKSSDNGQ